LEGVALLANPIELAMALIQMRICEHIESNKMKMRERRMRTTGEATSSDVIRKPLVRMSQITGF
jgi:hypothetical protein